MKRIATFAERLAEYRTIRDITLEQLSKETDLPAQTLNRYELGQRIPKVDVANDIAAKVNVNPLWLQGYDVDMAEIHRPEVTAGDRIRIRRNELKLPVERLAEKIGVPPDTISRYESGEEKVPGDFFESIAKALYTTPSYIMGLDSSDSSMDDGPVILGAAAHFDTTDPEAIKAYNEYVKYLAMKYRKKD